MITCGHRCLKHTSYADSYKAAKASKHLIGAEVDFYVQHMEDKPHKIIELIMQFYQENPKYHKLSDYQTFLRYEQKSDVMTPPWFNKEIFIKLYKKQEGRDWDNRHGFPYISLQVRYDQLAREKVSF